MKKLLAAVLFISNVAFCDWTGEQVPAHVTVENTCQYVNGTWVPNLSDRVVTVQLPGVSANNDLVGVVYSDNAARFEDIVEISSNARRNNRGLKFFLGNVNGDNGMRTVYVLTGTGSSCIQKTFFNAYGVKD